MTYTGRNAGDPVRVRLQAPLKLVPILGVGTLKLAATATMRLEQVPDNVGVATPACPPL